LRCGFAIVVLRFIGKAFLILIPLAVVGHRLHTRAAATPTDVTREVTRCLTVVRATARRGRAGVATVRAVHAQEQLDRPPGDGTRSPASR
jgi:hypothetical protein